MTKVVTLLDYKTRHAVEAALHDQCRVVHTESTTEAIRRVSEPSVRALVIAPDALSLNRQSVTGTLINGFPDVTTIAVMTRHNQSTIQQLVDLGCLGLRDIVDLSDDHGWNCLRTLIARASDGVGTRILRALMPHLPKENHASHRFFENLVRLGPSTASTKVFARELGMHPSAITSRFHRAGLPSPKRYLTGIRLVYASAYFENRYVSIRSVANRLEYSSPQSFARHIRQTMGMTTNQFRYRYSFSHMLDHFSSRMITPHRAALQQLDPITLIAWRQLPSAPPSEPGRTFHFAV